MRSRVDEVLTFDPRTLDAREQAAVASLLAGLDDAGTRDLYRDVLLSDRNDYIWRAPTHEAAELVSLIYSIRDVRHMYEVGEAVPPAMTRLR